MFSGILNVRKDAGFTSNDVVAKLRGILRQRKIGHAGTLDPDATGVLPVLLGNATRLSGRLTDQTKAYRCTLLLGKSTDTQDISGTVLSECGTDGLTEEEAEKAVFSFLGAYEQTPPMYSAKKVDGRKLYELARQGITVDRKSVPVEIFSIQIEKTDLPRLVLNVSCSKGTYVRTLCSDIGEKLGCGGCMEKLERIRSGGLYLEDSISLSEIERLTEEGRIGEKIIPVEEMFLDLLRVRTGSGADKKLRNGNALSPSELGLQSPGENRTQQAENLSVVRIPEEYLPESLRVCDSFGNFLAIYRYDPSGGSYRPDLMFL